MKTATKILIVVLIISGLMPLMACVFAAFNPPKLMEMFHLTSASTPDLDKTIVILGAAMIASVLIQFLAAAWIWKGKAEGLTLSLWVSFLLILASFYMLIFFSRYHINDTMMFAVDLVKGFLILALTLFVRKNSQNKI